MKDLGKHAERAKKQNSMITVILSPPQTSRKTDRCVEHFMITPPTLPEEIGATDLSEEEKQWRSYLQPMLPPVQPLSLQERVRLDTLAASLDKSPSLPPLSPSFFSTPSSPRPPLTSKLSPSATVTTPVSQPQLTSHTVEKSATAATEKTEQKESTCCVIL